MVLENMKKEVRQRVELKHQQRLNQLTQGSYKKVRDMQTQQVEKRQI